MTQELLRFDTGEVELAYLEWPGESPPLLLLHGGSTDCELWTPRVNFRGTQRTFAYDARGHGRSGRTPGAYRAVDFGKEAVAFLEGVIAEPSILIGHSMGANTAIYVAASKPEMVLGAALLEPPLYLGERGLGNMRAPFEEWRADTGRPFEDLVAAGLPPPRARTLARLDPAVWDIWFSDANFEAYDPDSLMERMDCPTLLQYGEQALGSVLYEGEVERAASHLKDVTLVEVKESGHGFMVSKPDEFQRILSEFVQQIVSRAETPSHTL